MARQSVHLIKPATVVVAAVASCTVLIAGCAVSAPVRWPIAVTDSGPGAVMSPNAEATATPGANAPAAVHLRDVPFFGQERYQCGPAALAMVLDWSGDKIVPDDIVAGVYTPGLRGSLQASMIATTRRHGRIAYVIRSPEELFAELAVGNPVIVLQNLRFSWWPAWHYAVVVGYDSHDNSILLHSGTRASTRVAWQTFLRTWKGEDRWGLLVLPPGRVPDSASARAYLIAVVGLEQVGQWNAAADCYRAALNRWSEDLAARIGLANAEFALDRPATAETVLRTAVHQHPHSAQAHNNLAHVLAHNGKRVEAITHARKAVLLGGKTTQVYRRTLEAIEGETGL